MASGDAVPKSRSIDAISFKHSLGLKFLKQLSKNERSNFAISPLSLGTAFAMLAAGLRGETKSELLALIGCEDEEAVHEMYSGLMANRGLPLKIANKFLVNHGTEVVRKYNEFLKTKYEAEVEVVDFVTRGREVEKEVNDWVSDKTNEMIRELLPKGSLPEETILVLLNAVYFKGTWRDDFRLDREKLNFTMRDGTVVKKDSMSEEATYLKYHETNELRLVRIPYKEGGCFMIVALPLDDTKHIDDVLMEMAPTDMASAFEGLQKCYPTTVELTLPKFKIEYNVEDVKSQMRQLGVKKIFEASKGDFGNMIASNQVNENMEVSSVTHKCVIEVDEKGTEAAAATSLSAQCRSAALPETEIRMVVDRAFFFSIVTSEGTPLFSGICVDP